MSGLHVNAKKATGPDKEEEPDGPQTNVSQGNLKKGCVGSGDENVNRALVKGLKDKLGIEHGEEGVVQRRTRVQQ
jgi:hypothetical protein